MGTAFADGSKEWRLATSTTGAASTGWFGWFLDAPKDSKRALTAASLGWMLDSFDVMLYSLVLASLMTDLGLAKTEAGILGSITLVAAAIGGLAFGHIADRFGPEHVAPFARAAGVAWDVRRAAWFADLYELF